LSPAIDAVPHLKGYMATKFTLRSGDKPHEMKF
jgi:large subunit ribosomal protein L6e